MVKTIIHAQTIQKRLDDKKLQIQECTVQEVKALDAISEDKAQERFLVSFLQLHSHLKLLSNNDLKETRTESGFKRVFATLFGPDVETFTGIMFLNIDQLEKQLDNDEFQEIGSMASFKVLKTQFQMFTRSGIESKEKDTSRRSGNDAHADDAHIRPIYDEEPMVEDLSKPVTTHYLPKEREVASVKPHHVIASSNSRNSSKNMPRFSSNDIVHNHYLEEAKKKTQESNRNLEPSVMPSTRSQSTANGSKPKPRIKNQQSRNWPASKTSYVTTKTLPIAEHSRNSRNFSDSKHFVCSTCQKCVFNANHDHYVTKFLNEVNSRAKVPSNQTTNRNKPIEQISVAKKPER
nr:hypothetical protein [Tanacetum cinerariifolium]